MLHNYKPNERLRLPGSEHIILFPTSLRILGQQRRSSKFGVPTQVFTKSCVELHSPTAITVLFKTISIFKIESPSQRLSPFPIPTSTTTLSGYKGTVGYRYISDHICKCRDIEENMHQGNEIDMGVQQLMAVLMYNDSRMRGLASTAEPTRLSIAIRQ